MDRLEFLNYNDRYCKFKLKGGKEVFGIVWEKVQGEKVVHYFASLVERMKLKENRIKENHLTEINLEEIVTAEPLPELQQAS